MNKFTKGMTYIALGQSGQRYVVHQTGLKSWRATIFTHVSTNEAWWKHAVLEGNASSLYYKLEKMCVADGKSFEVRAYNTDESLRKDMFSILKFGRFEE